MPRGVLARLLHARRQRILPVQDAHRLQVDLIPQPILHGGSGYAQCIHVPWLLMDIAGECAMEASGTQPRQQASSLSKIGSTSDYPNLERILLLRQEQGYERKADPARNPAANRHVEGCLPAPHISGLRACIPWLWSSPALLDTC